MSPSVLCASKTEAFLFFFPFLLAAGNRRMSLVEDVASGGCHQSDFCACKERISNRSGKHQQRIPHCDTVCKTIRQENLNWIFLMFVLADWCQIYHSLTYVPTFIYAILLNNQLLKKGKNMHFEAIYKDRRKWQWKIEEKREKETNTETFKQTKQIERKKEEEENSSVLTYTTKYKEQLNTSAFDRKSSSFLLFLRIGEYISLDVFYFVNLTSSCSLIPWIFQELKNLEDFLLLLLLFCF